MMSPFEKYRSYPVEIILVIIPEAVPTEPPAYTDLYKVTVFYSPVFKFLISNYYAFQSVLLKMESTSVISKWKYTPF